MKQLFFLSLMISLISLTGSLKAQEFDVPTFYEFNTVEDYAFWEKDVVLAINWLEKIPLNEEPEKRMQTNIFLFHWMSGSPSVSIQLQPFIMDLCKNNPDLLLVFMGGWTKYKLKNINDEDLVKLNFEGLVALLNVYQLGGATKDREIEELIVILEKGELLDWIQKQGVS